MPEKPWQIMAADFKGPIGGRDGYYFHVTIDTYSRYPEVACVKTTSFEKLKPALDEAWARHERRLAWRLRGRRTDCGRRPGPYFAGRRAGRITARHFTR